MFLPEPPVSPWATVLPLVLVMGVCMVKQAGDNGNGDVDSGRNSVISVVVLLLISVILMVMLIAVVI